MEPRRKMAPGREPEERAPALRASPDGAKRSSKAEAAPKGSRKSERKGTQKSSSKKAASRKQSATRKSSGKTTSRKTSSRKGQAGKAASRKPSADAAARPADGVDERSNGRTSLTDTGSRVAPRATSSQSGKYAYCIVQSTAPASFGPIGIGADPSEVHTVNYEDIAAVVSDTPIEVYDPTRENVLAHERVNETVMHQHTVIPMSFGTVFKTADDIVELLRSAYGAFRDVLQKMENKLEFGLKVLWDPDQVIREVEKEDESLRRLREEISTQRGSTYFARMQYGRLVDSLLQERSELYVREIFDALRGVCVASRANKPIGERMIMNAAFLVSRDQEPDFDAKVKEIGARLHPLTFKYTGPWPPYNFVNIRLKLERAQDS